jgi:hypothetical protein
VPIFAGDGDDPNTPTNRLFPGLQLHANPLMPMDCYFFDPRKHTLGARFPR